MTTHQDETRRMIQDSYSIVRRGERVGLDFPQIIVDSREPPDIITQVQAVFKYAFVSDLGDHNGDCHIQLTNGDLIVVERKAMPDDFCASIADGRLWEQCENIPKQCRFPWLVLHGEPFKYGVNGKVLVTRDWRGPQEGGWHRHSVEAALDRVQLCGMMLKTSTDYAECLKQIITICGKADVPHSNRIRITNPFDETEQRRIDFLAGLPGVGTERAVSAIRWKPDESLTGLLWLLMFSDPDDLPERWGKVTQRNVKRFLLRNEDEYFEMMYEDQGE